MQTRTHTLGHALDPSRTDCRHDASDITACIICRAPLDPHRLSRPGGTARHLDTCGGPCYQRLLTLQRQGA